jgi:ParB/RepB/Spo0J family partition protein
MKNLTTLVSIESVLVSRNYRTTFDQESLQELAQSIKQHGIIQALTVRPHPVEKNKYELIAGERRLRASLLAELKEIPVRVQHLTDEEAEEIRLIENLHRQDVHPLQEAAVYSDMLKRLFSPKAIAEKVGKSEKFVSQRLSLNGLNTYWQAIFSEGGINLAAALLIARLGKENQTKLEQSFPRKSIEQDGKIIRSYTANLVDDVIRKNFFLNLHSTHFKKADKDLYPHAGACTDCPKRTGCNKMLFAELDKEDYCLDTSCFAEKNKRHLSNQLRKLKEENIAFHQIATRYTELPHVLRSWEFDIVEGIAELSTECVKGIIVEGESLGKIVHIRLRKSYSTNSDPEQEKAKRKEAIRRNKIEKLTKKLAATAVIDLFANKENEQGKEVYARVMDYLIADRLGNGQSKEFLTHFVERYGWKVPIDRNDYQNRTNQIAANIGETPLDRKLELFIDLFIQQMANNEYSTQSIKMAELIGIDMEAVKIQATNYVDGKNISKGQNTMNGQPSSEAA